MFITNKSNYFDFNFLFLTFRTHIYDIDSFAYDAGSHWLPDLAKEEIRRKCIQVHRIF